MNNRQFDIYTYVVVYSDRRYWDDTIYKVFSFRAATPATAEEIAMTHALDFLNLLPDYKICDLILKEVNFERKSQPMFI